MGVDDLSVDKRSQQIQKIWNHPIQKLQKHNYNKIIKKEKN